MFGGTSNAMDTLPLDRTGNRRFMPVMVYPDRAECHILKNEELSRKYIEQVWAEAMEMYRSGEFRLMLSRESAEYLKDYQKQFMPEDKKKLVTELKKEAKKADMVWLASDEDREGEAISWHLFEVGQISFFV